MDKFSVEAESTMAHGNLYNASVFNKIRRTDKAVEELTVKTNYLNVINHTRKTDSVIH